MRAEYDSEANALSIDLIEAERWDASDAPKTGTRTRSRPTAELQQTRRG